MKTKKQNEKKPENDAILRSSTFCIDHELCNGCEACNDPVNDPNDLVEMSDGKAVWKGNGDQINVGTEESGMYLEFVNASEGFCPVNAISECG